MTDQTLDETWPLEADALGLTVRRGFPEWAGTPAWEMPLPVPENLKALRQLQADLFGKEPE